jgi:hypothetical protein
MRMNRWAKNGVFDAVFKKLQLEQIVCIKIRGTVSGHHFGLCGWRADARTAPGKAHDAPEGWASLETLGAPRRCTFQLLTDRLREQ